jgi:hypothetical protein
LAQAQPEKNDATLMLDLFKNAVPKGDDSPSVASWLLQDLTSHKERLIKGPAPSLKNPPFHKYSSHSI